MGMTPKYTEVHEIEITHRIAMGESLNSICKDNNMPSDSTVIGWLTETKLDEEGNNVLIRLKFSEDYARARLISYQLLADGVRDIAADGRNDYMTRLKANGDEEIVFDKENVLRSRLRVDTDKWILAKVLPKIYGDHVQVTQDVTVKGTIEHKAAESMNFGQVRDQRTKLRVIGSNVPEEE